MPLSFFNTVGLASSIMNGEKHRQFCSFTQRNSLENADATCNGASSPNPIHCTEQTKTLLAWNSIGFGFGTFLVNISYIVVPQSKACSFADWPTLSASNQPFTFSPSPSSSPSLRILYSQHACSYVLAAICLVFFMLSARTDLKDYSCYLSQMEMQSIVIKKKKKLISILQSHNEFRYGEKHSASQTSSSSHSLFALLPYTKLSVVHKLKTMVCQCRELVPLTINLSIDYLDQYRCWGLFTPE